MKAIFPCTGSLILTKNDAKNLTNIYLSEENNINETNNFNYFENGINIILDGATPVSISKLKEVLGISTNSTTQEQENSNSNIEETQIDDDTIASNPFFTTLKPVQ